MNIQSLNTPNTNIYPQYKPNFCANPFKAGRTAMEKRINSSPFDVAEKIYDDLWEELKLPKDLKLQFALRPYEDGSTMSFELENLCIGIDKNISKLKMHLMNVTGVTKAFLRHEIDHVQKYWIVIRYHGADGIIKRLPEKERKSIIDFNKFKNYLINVQKHFGEIKPEETEDAIKYTKAFDNYKSAFVEIDSFNTSTLDIIIKMIKARKNYEHNAIEIEADKVQKEYMPTKIEFIKAILKETWNILRNKKSN